MDNILITRKLSLERIRGVCVRYNLYTEGTDEEYSDMFGMASAARTDTDVLKVVQDIWEHSDKDELLREGLTIKSLAWYLFNECVVTHVN